MSITRTIIDLIASLANLRPAHREEFVAKVLNDRSESRSDDESR